MQQYKNAISATLWSDVDNMSHGLCDITQYRGGMEEVY